MPAPRPGILRITRGRQPWNNLGRASPEIRTPSLDLLAREEIRVLVNGGPGRDHVSVAASKAE